MAFSPAQRHSQMIKARIAARTGDLRIASPDSLHIQLLALKHDVDRLKATPEVRNKVELKRSELLPKWMPYVEKYLEAGEVYQNPIFAYCVVWLFDVGDLLKGLDWVDIAIDQKQPSPEVLRRSFESFAAFEVLQWASSEVLTGNSLEPYFSRTFENVQNKWSLHEIVKMEWLKFAGLLPLRDSTGKINITAVNDTEKLKKADRLLAEADAMHRRAQVRTVRDKIAARIRALAV